MHKLVNHKTPPYLWECLPNIVGSRSRYLLQNCEDIENLSFRKNVYEKPFFSRTIAEYNNVDSGTRESPSSQQLREGISYTWKNLKPWYYVAERNLNIIHARLRMKCSQLSSELFTLNLIEQPNCHCWNQFETAMHFSFNALCILYAAM